MADLAGTWLVANELPLALSSILVPVTLVGPYVRSKPLRTGGVVYPRKFVTVGKYVYIAYDNVMIVRMSSNAKSNFSWFSILLQNSKISDGFIIIREDIFSCRINKSHRAQNYHRGDPRAE